MRTPWLRLAEASGRRPCTRGFSSRPARRAVDLALQPPAEHLLEPARHREQRVEVDPRADAVALELPDEILGRDIARGVRREGTAAEAADRRIEDGRAALERSPRGRVARVAGVVEMRADRSPEDRDPL